MTASSELANTKPLSATMDIERIKLDFSMADLSFSCEGGLASCHWLATVISEVTDSKVRLT